MARIDTDELLQKVRKALPQALRSHPTDPDVREAAGAFKALDEALCADEVLPEEWEGDDEDEDDGSEIDGDEDADGDDDMSDEDAADEMNRVLGGG